MRAAGASAIVFDMAFTLGKVPEHDQAFAQAVAESNRVVLFQLLTGKRQAVTDSDGRNTGFVWVEQLVSPIPELAQAAAALAPWPLPKQQVTVHQFWTFKSSIGDAPTMAGVALQLHARVDDQPWRDLLGDLGAAGIDAKDSADMWRNAASVRAGMARLRRAFKSDPTLALRLYEALDGPAGAEITPHQKRLFRALAGLYAGDEHQFLNFYGPPGTVTTIPYDVMIKGSDPNYPPEMLDVKGKVVFVGFSDLNDPGQPDRFYTVFTRDDGVDLSGVEIAATAFGNILESRILRPSGDLTTMAAILAFGFLIGLLAYLLPATAAVPTALVLAGLYAAGAQYEFNISNHWLPVANPLLVQLPLALLLGLLGQYFLERREQRRVRATMARYVDPAVADQLIAGGVDVLGGRETTATVLFCDIRSFTTITEQLGPQGTVTLLNDYFTRMVECITAEGGMLDKFMGDALMAAFGVPVEHDDDADRAVRAAIAMLRRLDVWNAERAERGEPPVAIGIGLNSDTIVSGNIGSPKRMDFTLIGDGVNIAARLETACKQYSARILISDRTFEQLKGAYQARDVDEVIVVGKSEPVRVYEILDHYTDDAFPNRPEVIETFRAGRRHYAAGDWDAAINDFRAALALNPADRLSEIYVERCELMKADPPVDWDGVWRLETK
jgi:adenylate cyclase